MHYPLVIMGAFVFKGWLFWAFILFQPLLHLRDLVGWSFDGGLFVVTIFMLGPGVYFTVLKLRQSEQHYRQAYRRLLEEAEEAVGGEVLDREAIAKRYLSETESLKSELREVARTISQALLADRTSIFLFEGGRLVPAVSDEEPLPEMSPSGLLYEILEHRISKTVLLEDTKERFSAGFSVLEGSRSFIFCPVLDDRVILGGIAVESLRYMAFEERDERLLEALSLQVAQLMKKHRLLCIMGIEHELLQSLQRESENLLQSLELEEVTGVIKKGAMAISGAEYVFVMLKDGRSYVLMNDEDVQKRRFTLRGTLLEDIAANRQPFYFRDVRQFRKRALPFEYREIRSLAGYPLLSGKALTGMVVLASSEPEAFTERHLSIMHLYCNQASESLSRALLHEDIKMKALTDGLTGLYNHRHFQERLEENLKRAERLGEKLSLLLLDIDHFKKINDTYGHPVGDQVLRTLAATIDDTVREIDIPARYGGEEFSVLLLGAAKKEAAQIAERLRQRVKELRFNTSSGEFSITVSIGIATFPEDATTREALIEEADQALYRAKNSGRDRVVLAG